MSPLSTNSSSSSPTSQSPFVNEDDDDDEAMIPDDQYQEQEYDYDSNIDEAFVSSSSQQQPVDSNDETGAFIEEDFSPPPPPPQSAAKKQRRPPPPPPPQRIEKIKIRAKFDETKQENFIDPNGLNCKLYFIAQSLALIILIIMLTWLIRYFNGFNLIGHHIIDEKHIDRFINFHPLVMTFTMVFVMANCNYNL